MRSLKSGYMNTLHRVGFSCHFRHRRHDDVGGLRCPIGILSRLHIIEAGEFGHAPRAAALLGADAEFRAGCVDWVGHMGTVVCDLDSHRQRSPTYGSRMVLYSS